MKLIEKFKKSRRRARKARLRREIVDLENLIYVKLSPDYDAEQLRKSANLLSAKRKELAEIYNQEGTHV